MNWLACDIGGANLKLADGVGFATSQPFPLWQRPGELADALANMFASAPTAERLAVTMTGELADCFETKAEGVRHILEAVRSAAGERVVQVYGTDGRFLSLDDALQEPLLVAAANWHALARFAARYLEGSPGLLLDIGSTTCDLIPLVDGQPAGQGRTDPERLMHGELIYTGVVRSPICAVVSALPWRGRPCPVAQEWFATTYDAYLWRGDLSEDANDRQTADGGPATRDAARNRLARCLCADRTMFDEADAKAAADAIAKAQTAKIGVAWNQVVRALPAPPAGVVISGQGEFLARTVAERSRLPLEVVSLSEQLGPDASRAAAAHALAVLARENIA